MGKVKAWLMEMQELAYDLLQHHSEEKAKSCFLLAHPGQDRVFDEVLMETAKWH